MHSIRSAKAYYIAAFVLGAIIALLVAAPARSAETFHLDPDFRFLYSDGSLPAGSQ